MLAFALAVLMLMSGQWALLAQEGAPSWSPPGASIKVDVDLVVLPVTVSDVKGGPFLGLKPENFRLYDSGAEQTLHHFSTADVPFTMGLVLDRSASMASMIDDVYQAAFHTIRASKPDDEFFVLTFNHEIQFRQDFSKDQKLLEQRLKGVDATGMTALYDAALSAAEHMQQASHGKKALLVVTDGEDNRSRVRFPDLLETMRQQGIAVYVVGLFGGPFGMESQPGTSPVATLLSLLAAETGGRAYFPRTMKECEQACIAIAAELRHQYTLSYYPRPLLRDGSWRPVRVELHLPERLAGQRLTAHTRSGYFAPHEE